MAENVQTPPSRATGLDRLAGYREQIGFGLLGLSALFLVIPVLQLILWRTGTWPVLWWPVLVWGILLVLITLGSAAWYLAFEPTPDLNRADQLRVLVLIVAGAVGLNTAVLSLTLALTEPYSTVFARGLQGWRENPRVLVICGLALFGGLGLMFVGLQTARAFERTRTNLRRLLYGYNAVQSSFLLLLVLVLVNVLTDVQIGPFKFFTTPFDWTGEESHTLSPSTKNFLAEIKQPVKVILLLDGARAQMAQTLLENCKSVSPQITWQTVSPRLNPDVVDALMAKYAITGDSGLLVLYGEEGKVAHQFIEERNIFKDQASDDRDEGPDRTEKAKKYTFTGESALVNALTQLQEGKRSKLYFTQGHGELPLRDPVAGRIAAESLRALTTLLERENYDTAELTFGPDVKKVPADADVVIVAGPQREFEPDAVKVLSDYAKGVEGKRGKLIVLLDVAGKPDGGMVQTGLEGLLADHNVRVENNRILAMVAARDRMPWQATTVLATFNPDARGQIAKSFAGQRTVLFRFDDARTLTVLPAGGAGSSSVEELVQVPPGWAWGETDLLANPAALIRDLQKPENEKRLQERLSKKPLTVGVTVTSGGPPVPGHEGLGEPRMVVFGDASWISTQTLMRSQFVENNYSLFTSCLSWLRGRSDLGPRPPDIEKSRREYRLTVPDRTFTAMNLMTPLLMTIAILGLGVGVWVVRRR
jgi:hypothetical protein